MKLSSLLEYNSIVIQCHDNPDADAICSGYVLYRYFEKHQKNVQFIYSGNFEISKSNLVYLIEQLNIPIEYVQTLNEKPQLLLLTDCQYGEGNVKKFKADNIAVIDHHQVTTKLPRANEVRSNLGSCCSVIWNLLKIDDEEDFIDSSVGTALYYGLYSDTNAFSEISHPLDRDMVESLEYDKPLILKLKNMNLTLKEAKIAGVAMLGLDYHKEQRYAILKTEPCDPNILGLIGDFIVAVDTIDVCLVYSVLSFGVKFSVRSCSIETRADELASFLASEIGSGGGHKEKAGGILKNELIIRKFPDYTEIDDESARHSITNIIKDRMTEYFENSDIIYASKTILDSSKMTLYKTDPILLGYMHPQEYVPAGSMAIIRTISGDVNVEIKENTILMINNSGEVLATSEERFKSAYSKTRRKFVLKVDYQPVIKNADNGKSYDIIPDAKACISTGEMNIYAREIEKTTKLFPFWDQEKYMVGHPGDFIGVSADDPQDMFIIPKDHFKKTYKPV